MRARYRWLFLTDTNWRGYGTLGKEFPAGDLTMPKRRRRTPSRLRGDRLRAGLDSLEGDTNRPIRASFSYESQMTLSAET